MHPYMRHPYSLIVRLVTALIPTLAHAADFKPREDDDVRMKWFDDARFGMFIHWSPSSVSGAEIGWGRKAKRPLEANFNGGSPAGPNVDPAYDHLYKKFDPAKFDAAEWVKVAQDAGMKYMVFTTKHHEGFSMWPTRARAGFDISEAPYKNGEGDILRSLSDAAHAAHMRLGWYYSPRDWTHPDYGVGDNSKYLAFMSKQIDEILGDYGKIDLIWWDSFGVGDSFKFWHADRTLAQIKRLQPDIVTNNRCSFYVETNRPGLEGDFDTPEQTIGKYQINRRWESCITLTGHRWSYGPNLPMKSFDEVVQLIAECATGDGNLLFNIGPMPDGTIEPRQVALLRQVGDWMKKYGESVYSTRGGPFPNGKWGGATFKGNILYLHLFRDAPENIVLPALGAKMIDRKMLSGGPDWRITENAGIITAHVPQAGRSEPVTLFKLTFDAPLKHVSGKIDLTDPALAGMADIGRDATFTASTLIDKWSREKVSLLKGGSRGEFAFHTENELNPSIVIDLGAVKTVGAVVIQDRPGYAARTESLRIRASEDGKTWSEIWRAEKPADRTVAIPSYMNAGARMDSASARYLKIESVNKTPQPLSLKSVRVMGR